VSSLFDDAYQERLKEVAPLAEALRPRRLNDVVGQKHLVGPNAPLRRMAESGTLKSSILWGPAGTGKTTLARILAAAADYEVETISAVSSGVKDLREVIQRAADNLARFNRRTVLFIDEIHRFNKSQQDLLLPVTENGSIVLLGATTENPFFELNAALMSRMGLWRLASLEPEDIRVLLARGLALRNMAATDEALDVIVTSCEGDARAALTTLDLSIAMTDRSVEPVQVTKEDVRKARDGRVLHQSADSHYDQVSAFIKSVRGSDVDASLYWLVVLLNNGESPRFLARRLVILASEDVGLADTHALVVAEAAARAVEFVGLPECRFALGHATMYLAKAPKSNSVGVALGRVDDSLNGGSSVQVPSHLRDGHYRAAAALGHGVGYVYPHDFVGHRVEQQYLPDEVKGPFYDLRDQSAENDL
jgi:putative ATPase